jgi:hypothetical protein
MKLASKLMISLTGLILLIPLMATRGAAQSAASGEHKGQLWGTVRTQAESTANIFDKDVSIIVREYHHHGLGKIVKMSEVRNGRYAVDMRGLPADRYVVIVDTGGSDYQGGEAVVKYPGSTGDVHQNWTLSMNQSAIPAEQ